MRCSIALGLLLASALHGQGGFRPLRITVDEDGLYAITYAQLTPFIAARHLVPDVLTLSRDGLQIPIEIRGGRDGRFDPGDAIIFYGTRGTGQHTRDGVYILGKARNPRRIGRLKDVPLGSDFVDDARRIIDLEEEEVFSPHACVRQDVIRGKPRNHWYWKDIIAPLDKSHIDATSATVVAEIHPEPRRSLPSQIELSLVGPTTPGIAQRIVVNVNGRDLPAVEWDTALDKTVTLNVPAGVLERKNSIQIKNHSPVGAYQEPDNEVGRTRNRLWLDKVRITFPTLLMGPAHADEQVHYKLDRGWLKKSDKLAIQSLRSEGELIYDVNRQSWVPNGKLTVPSRGPVEIVCAGLDSLEEPKSIRPVRKTDAHMPGPGADWIVVTTSRLRPLIQPLADHRRARGFTPLVIETAALYDTFTHGRFDPAAISAFIRKAYRNWKLKPKYLLIVGDADHAADWISVHETVPTNLVMTDYNGATATDLPYGDVDGDGMPEVSVGRLPVRSPDEVLRTSNRIIDLETNPPGGTWRRRLRFIAGEARFGPVIDRLLESTFRKVIGEEVPPAFQTSMTWSNPRSPFYWPARQFASRVVSEFNAGSLVFTYVGHGSPQAFDWIDDGTGMRVPILDPVSARNINAGRRSPMLAIIACWTGEYDQPKRDCIAELLLRQPGGPVAVLASSRISHPYPDALIGRGLARAFFKSRRPVGDILDEARRIMLQESKGAMAALARPFLSKAIEAGPLVRDHLYLYNLLGDPATRLPYPERDLVVKVEGDVKAGAPISVAVACGQGGGKLILSLDRPVQSRPQGLEENDPRSPDDAVAIRNHTRANLASVSSTELNVAGGDVKAILDVPAELAPGEYHVTAYLVGTEGGDGIGAVQVTVGSGR